MYFYNSSISQLLIFPEGTDFTAQSKASSDRYADKHNLPKYEKVLHPKTTGFAFLSQRLRGGKSNNLFQKT